MKPIYQNIAVAVGASLKIESYNHSSSCMLANWHIHGEYEMVYVKNGSGTLRIGSRIIPYADGTLLMIGPNIPHSDFGNKDKKSNLEVVIQFGKEFLEDKISVFPEFTKIKQLVQASHRGLLFGAATKDVLAPVFESLQYGTASHQLLLFLQILDQLSHAKAVNILQDPPILSTSNTLDVNRLELVFQYVNHHYAESISTQEVAAVLGLTTNSFCRFFKKMTGRSFITFLNDFRTRKAVELLMQRELSVSEIMYRCGYNDPSYFTRQFKRYQGSVPSSFEA